MTGRATWRAAAATGLLLMLAVSAASADPPEPQERASHELDVARSAATRDSAEHVQGDNASDATDAAAIGMVDELIAQYFDSLND